jgi:DNA invertase Pin-like site-specific DNA recombinase
MNKKPRPHARYRPPQLTRNLKFILRVNDPESLFNAKATREVLKNGGIDLEAMLGPNVYKYLKPAPKPRGWKVNMEMVMRMIELRKRKLSYKKIADEFGLTATTVHKYANEITITG